MRTRHDDPEIPEEVVPRDLDSAARVELKTLSKENADEVARHLVMASRLIDTDPALAHRHALSAARRAGRVGVVRETLAITAYATGDFALALRELRTYRRISGSNDELPLMVDSERGVGRPERALELGRSVDRSTLPDPVQASLAIAMSGARLDLGQTDAALAELEIPQLNPSRAFDYSPDLFLAYAEVLDELGRDADAADWRARARVAEEALADEAGVAETETIPVTIEDAPEVAPATGPSADAPGADTESVALQVAEPVASADGAHSAEAVDPGESAVPAEPVNPGESAGAADPGESAEAVDPVEPTVPVEPVAPATSAEGGDRGTAAHEG